MKKLEPGIYLDPNFTVNERESSINSVITIPFGAGTDRQVDLPALPSVASIAMIQGDDNGMVGIFAMTSGMFSLYTTYQAEDLERLANSFLEMARQLRAGVPDTGIPAQMQGRA